MAKLLGGVAGLGLVYTAFESVRSGSVGTAVVALGLLSVVGTAVVGVFYVYHKPRLQLYQSTVSAGNGEATRTAITGTAHAASTITAPISGTECAGLEYRLRSGGRPNTTQGWTTYETRFVGDEFHVTTGDSVYRFSQSADAHAINNETSYPDSDKRLPLGTEKRANTEFGTTYASVAAFLQRVNSPNRESYRDDMRFALDEKPIPDGQTVHLIGVPETDQTEITLDSDLWIGIGSFAEANQAAEAELTRYRWALLIGCVSSVLLVGVGIVL